MHHIISSSSQQCNDCNIKTRKYSTQNVNFRYVLKLKNTKPKSVSDGNN